MVKFQFLGNSRSLNYRPENLKLCMHVLFKETVVIVRGFF